MKSTFGISITLILMMAVSFTAKANNLTGDVAGQVIEQETKNPVAFAQIVFENGKETITVTANEYGYYNAKQMHMGKYTMHVVYNNRSFVMNNVKVKDSNTSTVNVTVSNNEQLPSSVNVTNGKNIQAPATSQGEIVKYGSIIQDGKIIIIRNRPVSLYA